MTLQKIAAHLQKRADRARRDVYRGRYFSKKRLQAENHEHEQLVLSAASAADALRRCVEKLIELEQV